MNIYKQIERILTGRYEVNYKSRTIECRDLTEYEYAQVSDIYKVVYKEAVEQGLMSDEEVIRRAISDGRWDESYDINSLKHQEKLIKENIRIHKFKVSIRDKLLEQLKKVQSERKRLETLYNNLFDPSSAAYIANLRTIYMMVSFSVVTRIELLTREDYLELYNLISEYSLTEKQIRSIARNGIWFQKYKASKDHLIPPIFPPVLQMTQYQSILLTWSNIYDYAYNSLERPSDDIINDDDAFDKWLENDKKKNKSSSDKDDVSNVYIVADKKGAKEVYDMNTDEAKIIQKKTFQLVKQKGKVSEADRLKMLGQTLK